MRYTSIVGHRRRNEEFSVGARCLSFWGQDGRLGLGDALLDFLRINPANFSGFALHHFSANGTIHIAGSINTMETFR